MNAPSQPSSLDLRGTEMGDAFCPRDRGRLRCGFPAFGTSGVEDPAEMPQATPRVADDGCGVIRTDFGAPPDGLEWVVTDSEGFQVLGRNALGETRYRYYRAGEYQVVLEAFDGEKYAPSATASRSYAPEIRIIVLESLVGSYERARKDGK